ncbi:MAG: peptide-N-glycosidase F-related protein [Archangium sp.]
MKRLLPLLLLACAPTASNFEGDFTPVKVLPSCYAPCANADELCTGFDVAKCVENCSAERISCLEIAELDCFAARRCFREPPTIPFSTATSGTQVKSLAGAVTLSTSDGPWPLDLEWTGDDNYVFLARANPTTGVFEGSLRDLLEASPRNTHYFFTWLSDEAGFNEAATRWRQELQLLPLADREHWTPRVHFLSGRFDLQAGWVGAMMTSRIANQPMYLGNGLVAFAIDRRQRIREVGMLGRLTGNGIAADISMLANEVKAFEFEFARDERLAAEQGTTVLTLADNQTMRETLDFDVTIPELSSFDTLEVDLSLDCPQHMNANCGAWDYLSHLWLCEPDGTDWRCEKELARWITPYWREGRWVTDISQQLATLSSGSKHLRYYASRQFDPREVNYLVSLSLRFSAKARGMKPVSTTPLWSGGNWDATYDGAKQPIDVMIPADAKRVELVTIITGHEGNAPTNCAEFCDHEHLFTVNGVMHRQSFPEAQTLNTCADRVTEGVVPNQHGTWYYGRGGWCPGWDVAPHVVDVTSEVTKGQANTITYRTQFQGSALTSHLGRIVLSSWLVVWK